MGFSFSLIQIAAVQFVIGDFQLSFSQSQDEHQKTIWPGSKDPPCSSETCKIWTNDIVDCSYSRCHFVPKKLPKSIRKLVMTSVNVGPIRREHFKEMKQLTYLDLGNCTLAWADPLNFEKVFSNLTNLRFLNLSTNKLEVIMQFQFQSSKLLTHLDLSNNALRIFPHRVFDNLIKLEVINLSMNPIIWNEFGNFFSNLTKLKCLKLPGWIKLFQFPMETIENLTELEILWFGPNQFQQFPKSYSSKPILPRLKELSLENNNIYKISKKDIKNFKSLEILILSGNRIRFIEGRALEFFGNLSRLDLDRNSFLTTSMYNFLLPSLKQLSINYITSSSQVSNSSSVFKDAANLEELSLKNSKDFFKTVYPFKSFESIVRLNVRGNKIRSEMIEKMTKNLRKLRYLDLSENELFYLESKMFHCRHLEVLLLSDNWLSSVSITSLPLSLWNHLEVVDFSMNPFVCDCTMVWFQYWLDSNRGTRIAINKDETICSSPNDLNGTPISHFQIQVAMDCFDSYLKAIIVIVLLSNASSLAAAILYRFRWQLKYYHFIHMTKSEENEDPQDSGIYSYDAFVCYAEAERRWVLDVFCSHLESDCELKLCVQDRDWSFGEEVLKNFAFSIENSRKTVLTLSNAFAISPWSHFEMTVAQTTFIEDNRDSLIIVLFEEIASCNMNPMMKLLLMQRNHIEWTDHPVGKELFWAKLKHVLTKPSLRKTTSIPQQELFRSIEL